MRRLFLLGGLALLAVFAAAASARACSCAPASPNESLCESDAAIVGRLLEVVPRGQFQADYRYEVLRVYRGGDVIEPGRTLAVRSSRRAAACALPRRLDRRYGLFLTRAAGRWRSGICSVIAPRRLRGAALSGSGEERPLAGTMAAGSHCDG